MKFKPLSDLYARISIAAPGLNQLTALDELRNTAVDFCRETLVSQETMETEIAPGDRELIVESPSSAQVYVSRVMWVSTNRGPIAVVTLAELNYDRNWRQKTGTPKKCANETDGELVLNRQAVKAETGVMVRVACVPQPAATQLDQLLVTEYAREIVAGTLARVLAYPNVSWANPGAAQANGVTYEIGLSRARAAAYTNRSVAPVPVRIFRQA